MFEISRSAVHLIFTLMCVECFFWVTYPDLAQYEQPYDVDRGGYDGYLNNTNTSSNLCLRPCVAGQSKTCYYKFYVEPYTVLGGACRNCPNTPADCMRPQCVTADGYERAIITANRRLPGPCIEVCKGDFVVVDVINQLAGGCTTIHWHGQHQRDTPWMDGVPMVTQCPILAGQTFRYYFTVKQAGTFFWHSHEGLQKVDGLEGCLIVREPDVDSTIRNLYDFDLPSHVVFIQDWLHTLGDDRLPGQQNLNRGQSPDSYLVNGLGVQLNNNASLPPNPSTPMAIFKVTKGYRYRFRLIGGSCLSCPFRITFQNHRVTVINIDGENPVKPVTVDSVEISSGERYDVVVTTSQPAAAYWILVQGLEEECRNARQLAILCYAGSTCMPSLPISSAVMGFNPGYILNPHISNCTSATLPREICVSQLQSQLPTPSRICGVPDVEIILPFDFYNFAPDDIYKPGTYHKYFLPIVPPETSARINNVSYQTPPSPLLTQYSDNPSYVFCNQTTCKSAPSVCECVNVIKIPKGRLIEFILYDASPVDFTLNLTHPFHLHGYDFYVMEQSLFNYDPQSNLTALIQQLIDQQIKKSQAYRNCPGNIPTKDTIIVGVGGYVVFRIIADNPGFWFFHCHFAYHLEVGMALVFQVGDLSDMVRKPKEFPICNEFKPNLNQMMKW